MRSAARSAVPRSTGMAPIAPMAQPSGATFHTVCLTRKRTRRVVTMAAGTKSTFERWTGATMNAPVAGTLSAPTIRTRQ